MRARQRGFTFLELVVSMAILSLVVLTSFRVLTEAHFMAMEARNRLLAANTARATLEAIKNTPLANVPALNGNTYLSPDLPAGNVQILTNPANVAAANIATVTVRVTWRNPKNLPAVFTISTMRWRL
ncbi:MAG TPA: prepilin-type N-terminal cleavage/methylation domain-containing protein [Verrucomicrobiae bacterium]|jgi:prepilin-type N-terminal cleavage/methylation domain-containing protein|nr:prepilin-type N-terminal cleavage/methylation domain-containing protein [Verrucomicrobiae bacterium]